MEHQNEPEGLDIVHMQLEKIDTRRELARSKGAYARAILALQHSRTSNSSALDVPVDTSFQGVTGTIPIALDIPTHIHCDPTVDTATSGFDLPQEFTAADNGTSIRPDCQIGLLPVAAQEPTESSANQISAGPYFDPEVELAIASSSSSATGPGNGSVDQTASSEWPEVEEEEEASKFNIAETWYNNLENPTMEDTVRYEKAKMQEDRRRERLASRKALEEHNMSDDKDADFPLQPELGNSSHEPLHNVPNVPNSEPPSEIIDKNPPEKTRKKKNKISAEENRRSMQFGLDIALGIVKKKSQGKKKPRKRKAKDMDGDDQVGPSSGSGMEKGFDLDAFLMPNIVADAHASAMMPDIPDCTGKDKSKALTQLVAMIPTADQGEAKTDRQTLLEASKKFTRRVHMDGKGGWKIKGITTSLYHYQLLGAAFMRDRERLDQPPRGGLLCDVMGFGKTIQALANIVDGKCPEDDPLKTTLIVAPSHLVGHWKNQILKHCEKAEIGEVLIYSAKTRLETLDITQSMQKYSIVITTYEEIRRSYPQLKLKDQMLDEKRIIEMWNEAYQNHVGPLHRIKFRRIVLDEGHMIKNHLSSTSVAVRALTGKYKWILSGTPVQNYVTEFYPHFNFLEFPDARDHVAFVKDYCQHKDSVARQRLVNLCRTFLLRRTHSSRLFSLPVIKLPDIGVRIVEVYFCDVERRIYDEILEVYIANINGLSDQNNPRLAQSRCFLTMILRLRMICSHILTVQELVKSLLSPDLMREITALTKKIRDLDHPSVRISKWLAALRKGYVLPTAQSQHEDEGQSANEFTGDRAELVKQFHAFMTELHENEQWMERLSRTSCPSCGRAPEEPILTKCMHMYCEECYCVLKDGNRSDSGKPMCQICNLEIEDAAYCGSVENMELDESPTPPPNPPVITQTKKKQPQKWKKAKIKPGTSTSMFGRAAPTPQANDNNDEVEDDDQETDWIQACQGEMPSAKLSKVQEIVAGWITENRDIKVVIFTQFLNFVSIFSKMCAKQDWGYTCLTGKMSLSSREQSVNDFGKKAEIRVLIASLKAGGIGLDMTMANKCILVDLWWNEAVQDQAFCRLFRIGQEKDVEFVKIIVKDTIDDYMLQLQTRKSAQIENTMGDEALRKRDTILELLRMFADVEVNGRGGINVNLHRKGKQPDRGGDANSSTPSSSTT